MRSPLSALARTGLLAACVLGALPAPAEDKGILMIEQKIGADTRDQLRAWRDAGEQVTVRCDVYTTPGPLTDSHHPVDWLARKVEGAVKDLDSEAPRFTFGPFAVSTRRSLEYGTAPDSRVDLMAAVNVHSSNPERLPIRSLAGWLKFTPDEYQAFRKTVETEGALWSVGGWPQT